MARSKRLLAYHKPPVEIRAAAWNRNYLTPLELFRIQAWKSGQGLGFLSLNSQDEIEEVTGEAMVTLEPWKNLDAFNFTELGLWGDWRSSVSEAIGIEGLSGLLRLQGVGYPRATAVLTILDPSVWPVMDAFAVNAVFGAISRFNWHRAVVYRAFAEHLATEGHRCWPELVNIHEVDQAAMNTSDDEIGDVALPDDWTYASVPLK